MFIRECRSDWRQVPSDLRVTRLDPAGAPYRNIVLQDYWFRAIDYPVRQSCLNNGQSEENPDGSVTYVVSHDDPGVANWLDSCGLHSLPVVSRWQGFAPGAVPAASGQLVKRSELDSVLSDDVPRVTPAESQARLEERHATWLLRFRTD